MERVITKHYKDLERRGDKTAEQEYGEPERNMNERGPCEKHIVMMMLLKVFIQCSKWRSKKVLST